MECPRISQHVVLLPDHIFHFILNEPHPISMFHRLNKILYGYFTRLGILGFITVFDRYLKFEGFEFNENNMNSF